MSFHHLSYFLKFLLAFKKNNMLKLPVFLGNTCLVFLLHIFGPIIPIILLKKCYSVKSLLRISLV